MNIKNIVHIAVLFCSHIAFSQTIKGSLPQAPGTEITVKGFDGFTEKELAKTTTDSLGHFILKYPKDYVGSALLQIKNHPSLIVLLNHENVDMKWPQMEDFATLAFTNSPENQAFAQGIMINQEAEKKQAGLKYLLPLYHNNEANERWLQQEINVQERMFENFMEQLPQDRYVKYYLYYRAFVSELRLTQERYKERDRVAQHEIAFRKIDFAHDALWHSGLLKEIINHYYQVLELYEDKALISKKSIEANEVWLKALADQPAKQQEVAEYCFTMLEQKNRTKASEHIALSMLNENNCQLSDKQTDLFEQYRKLGIGKTAPNILLHQNNLQDLKSLRNPYKLVVFGASWCPHCQTDYPSLIGRYNKLKETHDLAIVYVSIDTDKAAFEAYYHEAPFITVFDGKGWDTPAAKDYHVFATPTYILLDQSLTIIAKIQSPEQLQSWLEAHTR